MNSTSGPLIAASVLHWRGWEDTIRCLNSILDSSYRNLLIILIINEAEPNSQEYVRRWTQERLDRSHTAFYDAEGARTGGTPKTESLLEHAAGSRRLVAISSITNRGFAGGHNLAINYALRRPRPADWIFHLNNDAVLKDGSLSEFLREERQHKASTLLVPEFEDTPAIRGLSWPLVEGAVDARISATNHELSPPNWWVSGSALLISTDLLRKLKEHDGYWWNEAFYLYMEDVELSLRVQRAGGEAAVIDGMKVKHNPASSTGGRLSRVALYYCCRNRKHLLRDWTSGWTMPLGLVKDLASNLVGALCSLFVGRLTAAVAIVFGSTAGLLGETGKSPMHDWLTDAGK